MNWQLVYCGFGSYMLVSSTDVIKLEVESDLKNAEINLASKDMNDDGVIFMKELYPTPPEDDTPIIGMAYKYEHRRFVEQSLVGVKIISSTVDKAKEIVESYWS